tara:strand:+ start:789 stop:1283 length:495 start_codon:yes stop_codon:yes gene_type:complete
MELVTPALGLVIWTTLAFLILLVLLRKFAWKPILTAVKERDTFIEESLNAAEKAKLEMESLKASNEELLKQAREERDAMLREARETKDSIVAEAKGKAQEEADKLISSAKATIEGEKRAAMNEIKTYSAEIALQVAEKILRENLSSEAKQKELAEKYVDEINLN